jgi:hypothetical protein
MRPGIHWLGLVSNGGLLLIGQLTLGSIKVGNFLISRITISSSRRPCTMGLAGIRDNYASRMFKFVEIFYKG